MTCRSPCRGEAGAVLRGASLALLVFVQTGSDPAQGQDAACRKGTAAATCDAARNACEQECRARLFVVDPARTPCLAICAGKLRDCQRLAVLDQTDASACRRAE